MTTRYYWGEGGQYGPFEMQDDGWPDAGQVLRYFRGKQKLTAKEFGKLYGEKVNRDSNPCSERWVLDMELKNKVPTDIGRRRIIAQLLSIPPFLLGLASLEDHTLQTETLAFSGANRGGRSLSRVSVDIDTYEKNIRLVLQVHRTSNARDLLRDIHVDIRDLETFKEQVRGDLLSRIGELLINNLLLASRIVRDRRQYHLAYRYANHAVAVARQIEDHELIATARHVRGLVKLAWGQFGSMQQGRFFIDRDKIRDAIRDFQEILQGVKADRQIHPQLQGFTMIQLSRAEGILKQSRQDSIVANALTLLDQAAETVGRDNIDDLYVRAMLIGSLSNLHPGGYYLHRANVFNTLSLPGKAITELNHFDKLAERTYGKDETRNQAWRDVVKAEAFMGLKEYQVATETARNALIACHSIDSIQNIASIIDIYSRLIASSYRTSPDVKELEEMLKAWYEDEYIQALTLNS